MIVNEVYQNVQSPTIAILVREIILDTDLFIKIRAAWLMPSKTEDEWVSIKYEQEMFIYKEFLHVWRKL